MKVFTYGSLMQGLGNHRFLTTSQLLGLGSTLPEYEMISLGSYPGILEGGKTSIKGELYEVNEQTLANLDRLEGHPSFYKREEVTLADGLQVQIYLLQQLRGHREAVNSGDWRKFCEDKYRKIL